MTTTFDGPARGDANTVAMETLTSADEPIVEKRIRLRDRALLSRHLLLGATALLCVLGQVMVLSASSVMSFVQTGSSFTYAIRQCTWLVFGVTLAWIASRLGVRLWRRFWFWAMAAAVLAMLLLFVPGLGVSVNGNRNWLDFGGPFRVQPAEAAKLALVIWGAHVLAVRWRVLDRWRYLLLPFVPGVLLLLVLIMAGGDLGTSLVVIGIAGVLLFVTGAPLRVFVLLGTVAILAVTYLSVTAGHRASRLRTWLDPASDPLHGGWQALHGRYALAGGGWWGVGLGASRQKWGDLPEAHTDFIFAVIGEELGLIGTLTVVVLFAIIVYAGMRIATRAHDPFVRLAAAGLTGWLGLQAFVNLGAVTGLLPITGIPLPLLSYGGSALLMNLLAIGMLLSLDRADPAVALALRELKQRRKRRRSFGASSA